MNIIFYYKGRTIICITSNIYIFYHKKEIYEEDIKNKWISGPKIDPCAAPNNISDQKQ